MHRNLKNLKFRLLKFLKVFSKQISSAGPTPQSTGKQDAALEKALCHS